MTRRLRALWARARALWRGRRHAERDLDDEIRAYVEQRAAAFERQGLAPRDAHRAALVEIGSVEGVKEQVRDVRTGATLLSAARDVRYGTRVLWRAPGYAAIVAITIAIGVGLNAAVFSVVHAVLWRPLPYPAASRLVAIEAEMRDRANAYDAGAAVLDVRDQSQAITSVAQIEGRDASLEIDGVMERVAAARVTDEAFTLLGADPMLLGRSLITTEDLSGYVVKGVAISHALWQRRFGADPHVVGRRIIVNNFDAQIVGVLRPDFRVVLPAASHVEDQVEVWMSREYAPSLLYRGLPSYGRLAPGVTIVQAQAELDGLSARAAADSPTAYPVGPGLTVRPLSEVVTRDVRPALLALGAAVAFVHLVACVNVASLLLVRARTRQRELAVRRALGATRWRLVRQLVAENLVVALLGGAMGLGLAYVGIEALEWLRPVHLPRQSEIGIGTAVMLWTAGLTVLSCVTFGLLPALAFTREHQDSSLHSARAGGLHLRNRHLHRGLVVAEVALSIVPLIAAGLMVRTFAKLLDAPLGFDPARVVTARVSLDLGTFDSVDRRSAFYREAIAAVRDLPGVEDASVGGPLPLAAAQSSVRIWRGADPDQTSRLALQASVMPGYLGVMRIPLRAGRDITNDDIAHGRRVVLVDERLAAALWQGDAIGKPLAVEYAKAPLEVVGVVGLVRAGDVRDAATPVIYVPSPVYEIEQTIAARTIGGASGVGPAIKQAIEALGPGRPVFSIRSMDDVIGASIDTPRFVMLVLAIFASAALVLAGVGLYGTLAYLTAQRRQEFGVRIALGATAGGIVRLVVREGVVLTSSGAALGLVGALIASRGLQGLLYGVTPVDAATLGGVAVLIAGMALASVGWTAWRAGRLDPTTALRAE